VGLVDTQALGAARALVAPAAQQSMHTPQVRHKA
jgi:hypothetical protein